MKQKLICWLMVFIVLIMALCLSRICNAGEYKVAGVNLQTGEMVAGKLVEGEPGGPITGIILDKTDKVAVQGNWIGKGLVFVAGAGAEYEVEVVE